MSAGATTANTRSAHLVPVRLGERDGGRAPLDAAAVDEHVHLAAKRVDRAREEAAHGVEVGEVALEHGRAPPERRDRVARRGARAAGALDEADVCARFGEGDRAGLSDACVA